MANNVGMEALKTWLGSERGRGTALAHYLKVKQPQVAAWLCGKRPIPLVHGVAIERFTGGAVTRKDLYPEDWQRVWPELQAATDTNQQAA